MNEAQYHEIARTCDDILKDATAPLEVLALSWLHVLSQHPENLKRYEFLLEAGKRGTRHRLPHLARSLFMGAGRATAAVARGGRPRAAALRSATFTDRRAAEKPTYDVLLVGWLVNPEHLTRIDDFYYGRLQAELAEHGLSSLLVLQNCSGIASESLAESARRTPRPRLVLPMVVGPLRELNFARQSLIAAAHLWRAAARETPSLRRRVLEAAGDRLAAGEAVPALRLHDQLAELCRLYRPTAMITLYEGHAWERCAWRAARATNPAIRCAGYQHTIIWKHSHALRRSLNPRIDPDLIATIGEVNRQALASAPGLRGVPVHVLGTHRYNDRFAALRSPSGSPGILVLPEGLRSECQVLFNFAIKCAKHLPDVQFVFRMHPVLPFEDVRNVVEGMETVRNIEVSGHSNIEDDFARAGHVLYRGSSTVVYAIQAGLRPYYVARPGEMPLDPLYALPEWRATVHSPEGFITAYHAATEASPAELGADWEAARAFCAAYAQPVTSSSVETLVRQMIRASSPPAAAVR